MRRLIAAATALAVAAAPAALAAPAHAVPKVPAFARVVVVVGEHHAAGSIIGNRAAPFINALAAGGALMTQSFGVTHPSQPNYLALFAGDTFGVTSNACPLNLGAAPNLASGLQAAGYSFGGYAESLPAVGSTVCAAGSYARKHVPWVNFSNVPPSASMPLSAFTGDGAGVLVSGVEPSAASRSTTSGEFTASFSIADSLLTTGIGTLPEVTTPYH